MRQLVQRPLRTHSEIDRQNTHHEIWFQLELRLGLDLLEISLFIRAKKIRCGIHAIF